MIHAGDETKPAAAQETSSEAAPHQDLTAGPSLQPPVHLIEAEADKGGSVAGAWGVPQQEEGTEHGKKEHGSLFASARAFFKRKEADGKH